MTNVVKKSLALSVFSCLLAASPAQAGFGYDIGDTVPDFVGTHADGLDDTSLYDLLGQKTVLNLSASWCVPCQDAATAAGQIKSILSTLGHDVNWIEILFENGSYQRPATVVDGLDWADTYGVDYDEVWIGDQATAAFQGFVDALPPFVGFSIPWFVVLDENMTVIGNINEYLGANALAEQVNAIYTPEPTSLALLGLAGLAILRRR